MDAKQTLSVLDIYAKELPQFHIGNELVKPERCDPTRKYNHSDEWLTKLNHILWAVEQCRIFVNEGRMEKAFRWLGFIQGALWMEGLASIEELANHNKPPEELTNLDPNRKSQD